MDPLSRKLFQTREAREKLRGMGGIMASSPQLAQTVQTFQAGGPIRASELQIPSVRSAIQQGGMSFPSYQMMSRQQRAGLGYPVSEIGGQLAFDRLGVGMGMVDPATRFSPNGLPITDVSGVEEVIEEAAPMAPAMGRGRGPSGPAITPGTAGRAERRETGDPVSLLDMLSAPGAAEAAGRTPARRSAEDRAPGSLDMAGGRPPRRSGARRAADVEEPLSDDEAAATPSAVPVLDPEQPETFETSYEQMLKRLEGVMGKKDVDTRKKAMANLAMIGLAIASGQSPNALTNIAQGALSGMQAIRAEEASREEQERAVRMAAMRAALDQESGMRSAEAESARDERKFQQSMQLEVLKSGLKGQGGQEMSPLDPFAESVLRVAGDMITNEGGDYIDSVRKAYDIVKNLPGYSNIELPPVEEFLVGAVDPVVKTQVDTLLSRGTDKATVRSEFMRKYPDLDPALYGL